jgi:hypothetical protein
MTAGTPWTPQENAILRGMWRRGVKCADIAKAVGRSRKACMVRAKRLGLGRHKCAVGGVPVAEVPEVKRAPTPEEMRVEESLVLNGICPKRFAAVQAILGRAQR